MRLRACCEVWTLASLGLWKAIGVRRAAAGHGLELPLLGLSSSRSRLVLRFVSCVSPGRWLGFGNGHGWLIPLERAAFRAA